MWVCWAWAWARARLKSKTVICSQNWLPPPPPSPAWHMPPSTSHAELKLPIYTFESCVAAVLQLRTPHVPPAQLHAWFAWGAAAGRWRCLAHWVGRARLNLALLDQLDLVGRTGEMARAFGIDFYSGALTEGEEGKGRGVGHVGWLHDAKLWCESASSVAQSCMCPPARLPVIPPHTAPAPVPAVLTRGSQYRVESMMARLAHTQGYLLVAASREQVARQPAMEALPLVMEPSSRLYTDPVVVLDFQVGREWCGWMCVRGGVHVCACVCGKGAHSFSIVLCHCRCSPCTPA